MKSELRKGTPYVVFQECPGEIALAFTCYGCPLACDGCHSPELWCASNGKPLSDQTFETWLDSYQGLITAVVFMGGEWAVFNLQQKLKIARRYRMKTCLYSGLNHITSYTTVKSALTLPICFSRPINFNITAIKTPKEIRHVAPYPTSGSGKTAVYR